MPPPNLPSNLPAWLDQVEAYCEKANSDFTYDAFTLNVKALTDLPLAVQVIRELVEAMRELVDELESGAHTLYQQKAILKTDRNWLLGKVQKARAALQEARDERT